MYVFDECFRGILVVLLTFENKHTSALKYLLLFDGSLVVLITSENHWKRIYDTYVSSFIGSLVVFAY